ncbi:MAG: type II toxin-antitoxin system VapC family toxin [Burkholderiaceae bacterium]
MRLLLDTHILLWALVDDARLPDEARRLIVDPENAIWISAACIWEIAIKHALARSNMPISADQAIGFSRAAGYEFLSISALHTAATEKLPPLHADPFDRLLIAQAITEPMHLLTRDKAISRYTDAPVVRV